MAAHTSVDEAQAAAGMTYLAKLHTSGRPRALIAAYLLLLHALHRQAHRIAADPTRPQVLRFTAEAWVLARAISASIATVFDLPPVPPTTIAASLNRDLVAAVTHAVAGLDPTDREALARRFALIAVAETQSAYASAVKATAALHGLSSIRREYTSPNPCDRCAQLAGVYRAPYPDELWETHPNCACIWSRGPDGVISQEYWLADQKGT